MLYSLKHKDKTVAHFATHGKEIEQVFLVEENMDHLPLPVKGILLDRAAHVAGVTDGMIVLSEDGAYLFEQWFRERAVPLERYSLMSMKEQGRTNVDWLLE